MSRNCALILMSLLCGSAALGQEPSTPVETLDVTMQLMPAGATLPDAVTKVIELPAAASDDAEEASSEGLDTANEARGDKGPPPGADAGEQGRERGQQMREQAHEQAQENRENAGHHGPPDSPGPPGPPGGPPRGPPTTP